jgi:hypothetical protein
MIWKDTMYLNTRDSVNPRTMCWNYFKEALGLLGGSVKTPSGRTLSA